MIVSNGIKMTELYFVMDGCFGLYNKRQKNPTDPLPPFIVLPRYSIYGDFQILHDLYPTIDMRTYIYDHRHEDVINTIPKDDIVVDEYVVMCLDSEKLNNLCDLYPKTGKDLRCRALDRRSYFHRE